MFTQGTQGRHFDDLTVTEVDLDQPEAATNGRAVGEYLADLTRPGIGTDIEVLWRLPKVKIPDTATDEICGKAGGIQLFQDGAGVRINHIRGDGMRLRGDDRGVEYLSVEQSSVLNGGLLDGRAV